MIGTRLHSLRSLLVGFATFGPAGQLGALQVPAVAAGSARPDTTVEFSTSEGTWLSLDVAPNGRTVAFELLGDIYTIPAGGGDARAVISGAATCSSPALLS